jgi:hypothetical protein
MHINHVKKSLQNAFELTSQFHRSYQIMYVKALTKNVIGHLSTKISTFDENKKAYNCNLGLKTEV